MWRSGSALIEHIATMKHLRLASLGKNVSVFDRDMFGFGAAVGGRWNVGVEDTPAREGSSWLGFHN